MPHWKDDCERGLSITDFNTDRFFLYVDYHGKEERPKVMGLKFTEGLELWWFLTGAIIRKIKDWITASKGDERIS